MKAGRLVPALLLALTFAAVGCGDESEQQPVDEPQEEPALASRYADDDPEALLAIIDNGGDKPPDSEIDPYAKRLDYMERFCQERRSLLADQVVNGARILKDEKGLEYTNKEMARAFSNALTGKLGRNQKCAEVFAAVLTIITTEE